MNCNDPPTFDSNNNWEQMEHERKRWSGDDLYKFAGDEIVVAELIGDEPIGHVYKDDNTEESCDAENEQGKPNIESRGEEVASGLQSTQNN